MFIDNIIEIQYNDINNVMSESNICCEFYLIPKIYFAFVFVVDVYWVLFLPLDTNSCDHNCWCKYTLVICTSAGQLSRRCVADRFAQCILVAVAVRCVEVGSAHAITVFNCFSINKTGRLE